MKKNPADCRMKCWNIKKHHNWMRSLSKACIKRKPICISHFFRRSRNSRNKKDSHSHSQPKTKLLWKRNALLALIMTRFTSTSQNKNGKFLKRSAHNWRRIFKRIIYSILWKKSKYWTLSSRCSIVKSIPIAIFSHKMTRLAPSL